VGILTARLRRADIQQVPITLDADNVQREGIDCPPHTATTGPNSRVVKATVRVYINYSGKDPIRNVQLVVDNPDFLSVRPAEVRVTE
jgi:hypothetical protein